MNILKDFGKNHIISTIKEIEIKGKNIANYSFTLSVSKYSSTASNEYLKARN